MSILKTTFRLIAGTLALFCIALTSEAQLLSEEELKTQPVFTSLESAMANPTAVYRLDLTKQKLKDFPPEILGFTNLNELVLDKNKLLTLPEEISSLSNLQRLSVAHNALDTLQKGVCKLQNLRYLNLSDNFITGIAEEVQQLNKLEVLILWQNPIQFFPSEIGMLENLKELDILHVDLNAEQQDDLRNLLPNCYIHFSPPCNCYND
ncbi:MAG: leucine-rich repeat domain-containing protein [Flavobacteriales bacterium]|nr:leucine-rich repeat domain-containing protein [Flavobacteriales bacterium]